MKSLLHQISKVAEATTDKEVYATAMYSLGLIKSPESVRTILSLYGMHDNEDIGNYALQQNGATILLMLSPNLDRETILAGIKASRMIRLSVAVDRLQYLTGSQDPEVQQQAKVALQDITNASRSGVPTIPQKLEEQ